MAVNWVEKGFIVTTKDWQMSDVITGDYVRIKHLLYNAPDGVPYPWKGLIAQAQSNPFTLFEVRRLFPNLDEAGIILKFPASPVIPSEDRRIAVRGQNYWSETNIEWIVIIESAEVETVNTEDSLLAIQTEIEALNLRLKELQQYGV